MKMMKKCLGAVALAAAFASVGYAVEPPAAIAYNVWWHNGAWVHQHTRTFPVYRKELGLNWWSSASGIAEAEWDGNTLLALPYTECHACSRIHIQAGDYGQTGWLGLSSVEGPYDAASGHYNHNHVQYNWYYSQTAVGAKAVACHEIGHALGRWHGGDGCMQTPIQYTYAFAGPGGHDIAEVNSSYPDWGH